MTDATGILSTASGVLTPEEGSALATLDRLLGCAHRDRAWTAVSIDYPRAELLAAGGQRLRATVLRWLVGEGGHRERLVLRSGRRTRGRVWDRPLNEGFALAIAPASLGLWLSAARDLPAISAVPLRAHPGGAENARRNRRKLKDMIEVTGTLPGDWVTYVLAGACLEALGLQPEDWQVAQRRLRAGSPLAALWWPAADESGELHDRLRSLAATPSARLMECAEERFARRWTAIARSLWQTAMPASKFVGAWRALGTTLSAWLDVADGAHRLDLTRAASRALTAVCAEVFHGDGTEVRRRVTALPALRTMHDRDEAMAAVGTVVASATRLLAHRDVMAQQRYGDERYDEAQVFVKDVDALLTPSRQDVLSVSRALAGVIG